MRARGGLSKRLSKNVKKVAAAAKSADFAFYSR